MKLLSKLLLVTALIMQQFLPFVNNWEWLEANAAAPIAPAVISSPLSQNSCQGAWHNVLVYQGRTITLYDKVNGSANDFVKFVHNQSSIDGYNFNSIFGGLSFDVISDAKPKTFSSVYWVSDTTAPTNHMNSRMTLASQLVYKVKPLSFTDQSTSNASVLVTTSLNPLNQQTLFLQGSGSPSQPSVQNECQNIYVAYCGDGVKDNGTANYYDGGNSTNGFQNYVLNGGEQCDDGNTNNGDGCSSTCQTETVNPPVCKYEQITANPQLNQPVQIQCGAPTWFVSVRLKILQNGSVVFDQSQNVSQYTFSYTPTQAGSYTYECVEYYNQPDNGVVSCGNSFTIAASTPVCNSLTLTPPNGGQAPFDLDYICAGQNSNAYNVTISGPNGYTNSISNSVGGWDDLPAGAYSVVCTVGGQTSPACQKAFTVGQPAAIDLSIKKTHMNGSEICQTYNSGSFVGFKLVVTNQGAAPATNFTVKDYLPAGYQFASASNGGTNNNGVVTWTIAGPLNQGQSMTLYLTGKVSAAGNYVNKTEVCNYEEAGEPQDPDSDPCTMGASGTPIEDDEDDLCFDVVNPITPYIDIELTKEVNGNNMLNSGNTISFTVTVFNKGNTGVNNISVKDYFSSDLTNVTASNGGIIQGNTITWNGINLAAWASVSFIVTATVSQAGDFCNIAEAGNYEISWGPQDADSNGWNYYSYPYEDDGDVACYWVSNPEPQNFDLELQKIINTPQGQLVSWGLVGFTLIVTNNSNVTVPAGYQVRDYWPTNIQFVSASDGGAFQNNIVTWTFNQLLAPYATKTIYLTGKILQKGWYDNCAEVGSYNGQSSNLTPHDIDSDPFNHPHQDVEDDESCVGFDVPVTENPVSCDNLNVTPLSGSTPLTINYNCTATNATTYTVNLIQNGITTQIGTNPVGTYTITNPGAYSVQCIVNGNITAPACQKTVNAGSTPYIDLNIKKLFADTNTATHVNFHSGDNISFKLIVGNSGTATATNFTVKDYLPSSLQYISSVPQAASVNGNTITWNIASLAPGQTTTITIQAKIIQALWDKNRTEVCDYEEAGELQDPDSDPCNMGPTGMPNEDDEDMIMWDVDDPTPGVSCDSLTINPITGTVPYNVSYNCNGTNAQNYTVKLFGGNIGPNGQIVGSTNQGSFLMTLTGSYSVQCFVNGTTTSQACTQTVVGMSTWTQSSGAKCNYITVNPNGGQSPLPVSFFCNGGFSDQYVVNVNGPNFNQTFVTSWGNVLLTNPGAYTFKCTVGWATAPACEKTVNVIGGNTGYVDTGSVQCLDLIASPNYGNAGQTVNFTCNSSGGTVHQIYIYKDVISSSNLIASLYGKSGSYTFPNGGNYIAKCVVDGNIDYSYDLYNTSSQNWLVCTHKVRANGELCAVQPTLAPYKVNYLSPSERASIGTISTYCTDAEVSSLSCNTDSSKVKYTVVKNLESCTEKITISGEQCPPGTTWNGTSCVTQQCDNGATNYPYCNQCPPGTTWNGYSCTNNPPFNYCGNGVVELGEDCDLGNSTDRTIKYGSNRGKICTADCRIEGSTDAPKCMDIDPPSINEGEYFPFWWNVDAKKVTTATSCSAGNDGKILSSSMQCTFKIYNGKRGTTDPVKTFTIPCASDSWFDKTIMKFWAAKQTVKPFGRYVALFDSAITNGIFWEYKIELSKIDYTTCNGSSSTRKSYDGTVCQYNFVVGEGYMIQKGANVTTLKDTSILWYYGFWSNTPRFDLYLKGVQQSLSMNTFDITKNLSYLTTDFVSKYDKLGENAGVGIEKVPGKNIFLYANSVTLKDADIKDLSTVIVKNGDLRLEGTIAKNVLYVVPNGRIIIGGDANCDKYTDNPTPQIIQGILVAGKGFDSDNYLNTNSNKERCSNGGLRIRGTLIGGSVTNLIEKRRVVLNDWFVWANFEAKVQHIIDGPSLGINQNTTLWTTLPGADEVARVLGVEKR